MALTCAVVTPVMSLALEPKTFCAATSVKVVTLAVMGVVAMAPAAKPETPGAVMTARKV